MSIGLVPLDTTKKLKNLENLPFRVKKKLLGNWKKKNRKIRGIYKTHLGNPRAPHVLVKYPHGFSTLKVVIHHLELHSQPSFSRCTGVGLRRILHEHEKLQNQDDAEWQAETQHHTMRNQLSDFEHQSLIFIFSDLGILSERCYFEFEFHTFCLAPRG